MDKVRETRTYRSYTDDFVESADQDYKVPEGYRWVHRTALREAWADFLYLLTGLLSWPYCRFVLHTRIRNRKVLRGWRKKPYFFFGNHTQVMGDVFTPIHVARKRTYTIANANNLKAPVLGPLLPWLGALPIPEGAHQMSEFMDAISLRIRQGRTITIYPEAHVWPYTTLVRPFPATSFSFPVKENAAVFTLSTTYQKRCFGEKPAITVYVDGPFFPDVTLPRRQRQEKLRDEVHAKILERSKLSTYEYIHYQPSES